MTTRGRTAVIVEDDAIMQAYLRMLCGALGVAVLGVAANADDAELILRDARPDFALMDVRLEGPRTGVDVANAAHAVTPDLKTIYITGSNEPSVREAIARDHPHRVLIKPVTPADLAEAFDAA